MPPHGGFKHYRWEVLRRVERNAGRWRDKEQKRDRMKKGKIKSSASKQIKEKCGKTEPTNQFKKKRGVRDWLLLQLAELVLLLLELASQGFVSCHLLCDLRTCTLGAKHKARVLVNVVGWVGGGGFHDTVDDRSGAACLLIIATAGGWKVLKEVKRKAIFS